MILEIEISRKRYVSLALLLIFPGFLRFYLTFEKARIGRTIVFMVWCLGIRKCHYAFLKFSIK